MSVGGLGIFAMYMLNTEEIGRRPVALLASIGFRTSELDICLSSLTIIVFCLDF